MFFCPRCCTPGFSSLAPLLKHVTLFHAHEPNFVADCTLGKGNEKCCRTFKSVCAFKHHVYRCHRDLVTGSKHSNGIDDDSNYARISCSVCAALHDNLTDLSRHYRQEWTHCEMCNSGVFQ
jgi:hypothetical protein